MLSLHLIIIGSSQQNRQLCKMSKNDREQVHVLAGVGLFRDRYGLSVHAVSI